MWRIGWYIFWVYLIYNFRKYWHSFGVTKSKDSISVLFEKLNFVYSLGMGFFQQESHIDMWERFLDKYWVKFSVYIFGHNSYLIIVFTYMLPFCTNSELFVLVTNAKQVIRRKFVMSGAMCLCVSLFLVAQGFAHIQSVKSPRAPWSYSYKSQDGHRTSPVLVCG